MTRLRKMLTKDMLYEQLNQVLGSEDEDNVPLSRLRDMKFSKEAAERKQRKRKELESEEVPMEKKAKFEWRPEDCAQSIGRLIKITGEGENKKCHYKKFEFHGQQYGLEETVLLIPEETYQKPYVAIIKDIYVQGKEGYVKLEVQWFYRPEDVEKKSLGNWKINDSKDLFYSFHRDEVFAESVKHRCIVHFVPENKEISDRSKHPGFIVQHVYNSVKKKLEKLNASEFDEEQKHEIEFLIAKTISLVGDLSDVKIDQKTNISRRKRLVPRRFTAKADRMSPESSNAANLSDYKLILEKFEMLTGDSDRDKILEKLMEAVEQEYSKKNQAGDCDLVWPNDVVPVVRVLEQVAYDSFGNDRPKYNHKLEILVGKLKDSRVLPRRILDGELKPEQVMKMTPYELMSGFTFDEMKADVDEPTLKTNAPSKSGSIS